MRSTLKFLEAVSVNQVLLVTFFAWFMSCLIKGLLEWAKNKKLDISRFMGPGGMPSSHSTLVMALMISIGKYCGFDSPEFAITCVLSLVVMYDASGIRRAAGQQAQMINQIMDAWNENDPLEKEIKLKELLGHTPLEVFAGALLGVVIAWLF